MCQLTYANSHSAKLNRLIVYTLGRIGSDEKHDDGCGFICSDNSIWKTNLAAHNITNLGDILSAHITKNSPLPFHIRQATYGIEVTKENAHPFVGKHFLLMHNGTLLPRSGEEPKDKKHDSDSLKFLKALDECKDISPNASFEELLNGAMNNFAGKFAFIIREIETNVDFIVRGRTAELWISKIKLKGNDVGYIINTSKDTMKNAFLECKNIWEALEGVEIDFSEPKLLEQESIFIAGKLEIKKVGKAIEYTPVKKETAISKYSGSAGRADNNAYKSWEDYGDAETKGIVEKAGKIYDFLHEHFMGLMDFQVMVMISGGLSLLELTEEDLEMFIDYVIPKISANKKVRTEIKDILKGAYIPNEIYEKYDLEYPWTVNDGNKVIAALKDYYKEK